uniref:Uncharacterized protein n=1 Tax=Parastrongyloides trichosuri TaxID=131310 RepID=A0A0N4ZEC4_PARTI
MSTFIIYTNIISPFEKEKNEKEEGETFGSMFNREYLVKLVNDYEEELTHIGAVIDEFQFISEKLQIKNDAYDKYITEENLNGYVYSMSILLDKPLLNESRYKLLRSFKMGIHFAYSFEPLVIKNVPALKIFLKHIYGPFIENNNSTIVDYYNPGQNCMIRDMALETSLFDYSNFVSHKDYSYEEFMEQLTKLFENVIPTRIRLMDHNQKCINNIYPHVNDRYNILLEELLLLSNICCEIDDYDLKLTDSAIQSCLKVYGNSLNLLEGYLNNPSAYDPTIYQDITVISRVNLALVMECLFIILNIISKTDDSKRVCKYGTRLLQCLHMIWLREGINFMSLQKLKSFDYRYRFAQFYGKYFEEICQRLNINYISIFIGLHYD